MKMVSIGEALPEECQKKLTAFLNDFKAGALVRTGPKSVRLLLRERVLDPHRQELEGTWDLDYLSYALCWAIDKNTGLNLLEL